MRALLIQVAGAVGIAVGVGWLIEPAAGVIAAGVALLAFGITEERG
jgi:hypothetical protein